MWELRWVLLALGILLIVGVWVWSGRTTSGSGKAGKTPKSLQRRSSDSDGASRKIEPATGNLDTGAARATADGDDTAVGDDATAVDAAAGGSEEAVGEPAADGEEESTDDAADHGDAAQADPPEEEMAHPADRIVTVRCQTKRELRSVEQVVLALRAADLRHGRYGIFHRHAESAGDEPLFSVANLTEPGTFDLSSASDTTTAGVTLFMVLPGPGDAVERFDLMVETARKLAGELDGELHDESGSAWSVQRERFIRDEIILDSHERENS